MNHIDLFSGIGGFSLAAQTVWGDEYETVCFVEMDKFCQQILHKHWPDVPIVEDVRDVERILAYTENTRIDWRRWVKANGRKESGNWGNNTRRSEGHFRGKANNPRMEATRKATTDVTLLTGGFPCQGFSVAGKQRGKEDDRYLWPAMFEVIKATRPHWVIGENVAGIINMALDTVLSDLENEGYSTQAFIIPACAQNAPHRRDRVWIVANTNGSGRNTQSLPGSECVSGKNHTNADQSSKGDRKRIVADTESARIGLREHENESVFLEGQAEGERRGSISGCSGGENWAVEPNVGRVAHGIPSRVDRLKSLGNAIVPQVVIPIMEAIKEVDELTNVPITRR